MVAQCLNLQSSHKGVLPQASLVQCRNLSVGNAVHKHVDESAQTEDANRALGIC